MKDQVLSIEQMQVLKELGINTSKAKIYWVKQVNGSRINTPRNGKPFISLNNGDQLMKVGFIRYETTPTFTLQDMIELMPSKVIIDYENYYLCVDKNCTAYLTVEEEALWFGKDNGILINTYEMLVWLAENKYI